MFEEKSASNFLYRLLTGKSYKQLAIENTNQKKTYEGSELSFLRHHFGQKSLVYRKAESQN